MTGRKGRVVSRSDGTVAFESRAEQGLSIDHVNLREKERFMSGEKVGCGAVPGGHPCAPAHGLGGTGVPSGWLEDHQLCVGVCTVLLCLCGTPTAPPGQPRLQPESHAPGVGAWPTASLGCPLGADVHRAGRPSRGDPGWSRFHSKPSETPSRTHTSELPVWVPPGAAG